MLRLKIYMPIVNKGVDTLDGNRVSDFFSKNSNLKYFLGGGGAGDGVGDGCVGVSWCVCGGGGGGGLE